MAQNKKSRRTKIHEVTAENDIRYRGPLTYQHFQILGWLCIAASQAALILNIIIKTDPSAAVRFGGMKTMLGYMSELSLPLLLIANFAQILDDSDGYKKQLLKNAAAAALVFGLSLLLFYRYLVGGAAGISTEPGEAETDITLLARLINRTGFVSFNLFIDLLMCTLVMFFLNYRPKRVFTGKLEHVFRLFTLLPIAYEVICMILKVKSAEGDISLPVWAFPLMTVKPPMTFVLFIILAVFIKTRELRFRRHGKTHEDYQAFLRTNRNSLGFSVFLAVMVAVVSFLDFAVLTTYSVFGTASTMARIAEEMEAQGATASSLSEGTDAEPGALSGEPGERETAGKALAPEPVSEEGERMADEAYTEMLTQIAAEKANIGYALGFGGSIPMFVLAPLILLFSYTREPRMKKAGMFIPLGGIALILFMYLEGFRYLMWHLPVGKIDLKSLRESVLQYLESMQ